MKIDPSLDDDIEMVFVRAKKLIELDYWDNLTQRGLDLWIQNFKTREEKYLAAAILHALIFRNRKSIKTLGDDIFQIILPEILEEKGIYKIDSISNWIKSLTSNRCRDLPIRFSAIDDIDDKGVKSSSTILSELKGKFFDGNLSVNSHNLAKHVENGVKAVILFDDIIGTGEQFDSFYQKRKLNELDTTIIYIPFAAVRSSAQKLDEKYGNLVIYPVELIDDTNKFFCESNDFLCYANDITPTQFRDFYLKLCKDNKINLNGNLGIGELELTYIFSSSTPNNNLAMLMHKGENWSGLFTR